MEEHLVTSLQATLSLDTATRKQAETTLLELNSQRSYGLALCKLILSPSLPIQIRQAAAISLRKWIKEKWSPLFDVYKGFGDDEKPVLPEDKPPVRQALLQALALPGIEERRIRTAAAATLSNIASSDWPDDFPELLPSVQALLRMDGASVDALRDRAHGALVFLSDFWSSEMDERQIIGGAKDMLPLVEAVLANGESYPAGLRSRCVLIFRQLLESLYMVKNTYPQVSKQIAKDVLPRWYALMEDIVRPDLSDFLLAHTVSVEEKQGQLSLANEAWRTLKIAIRFRAQIKDQLHGILATAIHTLRQLDGPFATFYLSSESKPLPPHDGTSGDSHASTTLLNLVCSIVDLASEAVRGDRARSILLGAGYAEPSPALQVLVVCLVDYARVTVQEEQNWSSDANAFVLASDEDSVEFGLRVACVDLVQDLLDTHPQATVKSLCQAIGDAISPTSSRGWKGIEAALTILGGVGEEVRGIIDSSSSSVSFPLNGVFQTAVLPNVKSRSQPLLTGRAYIFASQFATALPSDLARQLVEAAVEALESHSLGSEEETLIIKLSAVRCLKNFYRQLSGSLLGPYIARIIARLGPLLSQATGETLVLVLETIECVVGASGSEGEAASVSPQTYAELARASLSIWQSHLNDYVMLSVLSDLLENLAAQKTAAAAQAVLQVAQATFGPAILTAAVSSEPEAETLLESAVSLTEALLKGACSEAVVACQSVRQLMGPIIRALQNTEDRDVVQSGIGCLTLLVRKGCEHVVSWRDANEDGHGQAGTTVVPYFIGILSRLLIVESESGGLRVGELVIALLRKMPQELLPVLPDLLHAMVRRLDTAKTVTFAQSLILPFAFLIKDQCDVVLDLLQSTRVSRGGDEAGNGSVEVSGLQVLASKWAENAETIQGYWAQRMCTFALTRLLGTWAQGGSRGSALEEILVPGDAIPDTSDLIRTRSRALVNPQKFVSLPFPIRALKMLLSDWEHTARGSPALSDGEDGGDGMPTDKEDDEWDDDEDDEIFRSSRRNDDDAFLSDLLNGGTGMGRDFDDEEGDGDEDAKEDAVYRMDLRAYLCFFFQEISQNPRASLLAQGLTGEEQRRLRNIMSGVRT